LRLVDDFDALLERFALLVCTETAGATMSNEAPDLAAVRAAELDAPPIPPRPDIAADGDLFAGRAADAATFAYTSCPASVRCR
jgi:hypothetical protein